MPRSVTVRLRAGVGHAVLPDNRSMLPGVDYDISYDDYKKLGQRALSSMVQTMSVNEDLRSRDKGVTAGLTTGTASLPTYVVGGVTYSRRLGQVTEGLDGELFKLVRTNVVVAQGDVLVWVSKTLRTVTNVHAAGAEFAGVAIGAGTANQYVWIPGRRGRQHEGVRRRGGR